MNNNNLLQEVIQLVSEESSISINKIHETSRLLYDLGIDGMDAIELLEAYSEKFNVDLSEMNTSNYFGPESGCNPILVLYWLLFRRDQLKRPKPLTIADLVRGAETKKLV